MVFQVMTDIVRAIVVVFTNPKYLAITVVTWIIFLFLFAYLAIFSVPGSDIEFFLSISKPYELLVLLFITVAMAVVTTMNIHIFRMHLSDFKGTSIGISAIAANIISLVLVSASCIACLAAFSGVIVTPILFALFQYRFYAIGFSLLLLLISLHYASQKIIHKCEHCGVAHTLKPKKKKK